MKALSSSPSSPRQRTSRRTPKPLMEKRRRERINHSLETIRLLMLDNTHDEKLKNPKVEKAEILESVVHFLKKEEAVNRMAVSARAQQRPTRGRVHSYQDGMRSCLMRVSHFIATKSQSLPSEPSSSAPEPRTSSTQSPGHTHRALAGSPAGNSAALSPQPHGASHVYLTQVSAGIHGDTNRRCSADFTHNVSDPVWRPWPQ